MVYKVIGLMSGSSLDGLDIAYVHLQQNAGKWEYQFLYTACHPYSFSWRERLVAAPTLSARDYQLLHVEYGHWLGAEVLRFVNAHDLAYQVQLIASHGHTAFHQPAKKMTAQLGDGAALAATTGINVVSDLRAMDLALGGQGAPIVPIGEKLLFPDHALFLNLGGIANISAHRSADFVAFDVCPANRVLNLLAASEGRPFDDGGALAATGQVNPGILGRLDALPYYAMGYPKSLDNEFGTAVVFPILDEAIRIGEMSPVDALRTYTEHIAIQIARAVGGLSPASTPAPIVGELVSTPAPHMLVTGGGAHNRFLIDRLRERLAVHGVGVTLPEPMVVDYKEALIMALIGVLRWRENNNVLASVTGARRDSVGGAVWLGQEV